jgi:hypothetical protein
VRSRSTGQRAALILPLTGLAALILRFLQLGGRADPAPPLFMIAGLPFGLVDRVSNSEWIEGL